MSRRGLLRTKRIYEPASEDDGFRIFVERLWPRGISKDKAAMDLWLKEIAPSTELRKWFSHDPSKWNDFRKRYESELREQPELTAEILGRLAHGSVTLLYASREEKFNAANALLKFLDGKK